MRSKSRAAAARKVAFRIAAALALHAALLAPVLLPLHVFTAHAHAHAHAAAIETAIASPSIDAASAQPGDESDDAGCPTCRILRAAQHAIESAAPPAVAPPLASVALPALSASVVLARSELVLRSRAPPIPA